MESSLAERESPSVHHAVLYSQHYATRPSNFAGLFATAHEVFPNKVEIRFVPRAWAWPEIGQNSQVDLWRLISHC
jgi:hypothetical protein